MISDTRIIQKENCQGTDRTVPDKSKNDCERNNEITESSIKCCASQVIAIMSTNTAKFANGTLIGYTSIIIADLYKKNAEIEITLNELTWLSSNCFMAPVGSIIVGFLTQSIGSRVTMMISTILNFICYILFYCATNSTMLLIAEALIGLVYTVSFVPSLAYIAEVSQPHLRATFLASNNLFLLIGAFYTLLLGNMLHWRTIALANCSIPIIGFITMLFIPDSPQWLASKGRMIEAERALLWLRGWTTPRNVRHELDALKNLLDDRNASEKLSSSDSNTESSSNSKTLFIGKYANSLQPYLQRAFLIPLATVCCMFTLHTFSGSIVLNTYSVVIFEMIKSPIEKYSATAIFEGLRVLASLSCLIFIKYTGKRKLSLGSMTSAMLSYLIISVVLFLTSNAYISNVYTWIPAIMIMFATFLTAGGIDKVVYMLNTEIFSTQFRGVGTGIGLFVSSLLNAVTNKIFLAMVNDMTLPGVYLFYAFIYLIGVLSFYFMIPETNGRSLKELGDHFSGIKRLTN